MSEKIKITLLIVISLIVLGICGMASIALGSRNIPFCEVMDVITGRGMDGTINAIVLARIPRTVLGIFVGIALGISGALMQSITRNPIADPSILGVNTGASLFVVAAMAYLHVQSGNLLILFAFAGAMLTALAVYGIAAIGNGGASPMKLALSGAAMSTALSSLVSTVMMPDSQVMKSFRFWQVGSVSGGTWANIRLLLPYLIIGVVMALLLSPALNGLALGDEMAATLGINVNRTRFLGAFAGILLCAATTAVAGPIGFVGLMVPHIVRLFFGANLRITMPVSAIFGAILLTAADVIGRLVIQPAELEVGIILAILGAPIFITVVRKAKLKAL